MSAGAGAGVWFAVLVLAGGMAGAVLAAGVGVSGGALLATGIAGAPGVMGGAMIGGVYGVTGGAMTGLLMMADGGVRGGISVLTGTVLAGLLVTATGVTAGVLAGVMATAGAGDAVAGLLTGAGGALPKSVMPGRIGENTTSETLPRRMLTKRSSMRVMTGSIGFARVVEELEEAKLVDTGSLSSAPWMAL